MKKFSLFILTIFSISYAEACLTFPCGMYSPNHPANNPYKQKPMTPSEKNYEIPKKVSCTMKRISDADEKKQTTATISAKEGQLKYSNGIDIGKENYSFVVEYIEDTKTKHSINITITENNHVQDEVSNFSCGINLSKKQDEICTEKLNDKNKEILEITCKAQY